MRFAYGVFFFAVAVLKLAGCANNPERSVVQVGGNSTGGAVATGDVGGPAVTDSTGAPSGVSSPPPMSEAGVFDDPSEPTGMSLVIPGIDDGGTYPEEYSCNGDDVLPAMRWGAAPQGTLSYALIFTDLDAALDAPGPNQQTEAEGRFVHWALFDIPPGTTELPRDIGAEANPPVPAGSTQVRAWATCGVAPFELAVTSGFLGPCPQESHDYMFELYALSVPNLEAADCNVQPVQVATLIEEHPEWVVQRATVTATYTPPAS